MHVFLKCLSDFVLHVTRFPPSLFMGFTHAPVCRASSLFLLLRRILQCTSSTCNVPVSQQWTLSQRLASHLLDNTAVNILTQPPYGFVSLRYTCRSWAAGVFVYLALKNVYICPHANRHSIRVPGSPYCVIV